MCQFQNIFLISIRPKYQINNNCSSGISGTQYSQYNITIQPPIIIVQRTLILNLINKISFSLTNLLLNSHTSSLIIQTINNTISNLLNYQSYSNTPFQMLISKILNTNYFNILISRFALKKFNLPDLGEKIKQGKIQKWYVKQGENVHEFQKIADITSDKQFTQLTASDTGTITKIFHLENQICQVGSPLFQIDIKAEAQSNHQHKSQKTISNNQTVEKQSEHKNKQKQSIRYDINKLIVTPAVRTLLKHHNLQISQIQSTRRDGRIIKEDVLRYIEHRNSAKQTVKPIKQQTLNKPGDSGLISKKIIQMNNYQRGMQKTMDISNKIPHLSYHEEFDLTQLIQFRQSSKNISKQKITFMSYFIKTFSMALSEYPKLNSWYNDQSPFQYTSIQNHNITIAIDSPNGLAVPNIKNVQNLSIIEIQKQLNRLRKAAENGRIQRKDIQGGTISISNIGTVEGTYSRPLILSPQVSIVGLGKTRRLPHFQGQKSSQAIASHMMSVSFSADHRVIDGGTIANFSNRWKQYLQNPALILLQLR